MSRADFGLFKGTKPMRKRKGRGRTVCYSGIFASTKCLGPADFESLLERDFQTLLCADPRVQAYAVQAHQLTYWTPVTQGTFIKRLYTPDIVVQLRDGRIIIIEVKAEFLAAQTQWQEREPYIREAYARDYAIQFVAFSQNCQTANLCCATAQDQATQLPISRSAMFSGKLRVICVSVKCAALQISQTTV
jgi:hypothetical protein